MFQKRESVITAIFIYIILMLVYVVVDEKPRYSEVCNDSDCARFCCKDAVTCNEKFIRNNFNGSEFPNPLANEEFKILFGYPTACSLVSADITGDIKFSPVRLKF